ncbi:response regulator transcription factor [Persicobacter psychrovividus]|uniref:DNA-binding response regulator n=1 Tax=Persicobacter psychrovividus TaxID=387638 RepID=A0ABM7VI63_9BACT|nr:DNA-binding response regulator [Persicobacter psychrovividus]
MMKKIRILLVDDHTLVRNGIKALLSDDDRFEVVGEAGDGQEALKNADLLQPDIVLMDIRMPVMNGLEAAKLMKNYAAQAKVVMLSMHHDEDYVLQAVQVGAFGYLLKDIVKADFINALLQVSEGHKYFAPAVSEVLVNSMQRKGNSISNTTGSKPTPLGKKDFGLTKRELQVLSALSEGKSNSEMAEVFNLSQRTVETHRFNIMKKVGVKNVLELLNVARKEGILDY